MIREWLSDVDLLYCLRWNCLWWLPCTPSGRMMSMLSTLWEILPFWNHENFVKEKRRLAWNKSSSHAESQYIAKKSRRYGRKKVDVVLLRENRTVNHSLFQPLEKLDRKFSHCFGFWVLVLGRIDNRLLLNSNSFVYHAFLVEISETALIILFRSSKTLMISLEQAVRLLREEVLNRLSRSLSLVL